MPTDYYMAGSSAPQNGAASSLAGVAEYGDQLHVQSLGVFVNVGTKAAPRWVEQTYPDTTFAIHTSALFLVEQPVLYADDAPRTPRPAERGHKC